MHPDHSVARRPRSLRQRAGFTIVEVALAAAVMAFAISGSIVVMQAGFKSLDNARNTTLASQVIQSEMERIRLLNWSDVNAFPAKGTIVLNTIFPTGTTTNTLNARFTATRTCTGVTGKETEMKEIVITVTWKGIDGLIHTRSTTGYYCKNGLYDYYYTLAGS